MSSITQIRPKLSLRLMLILVGVIAVTLGLLSYRIRAQQDSVYKLRQLGGQMEVPEMNLLTWLAGISVDSVQFLGPATGDESVSEIGDASASLNVKRMTFFETRVTQLGLHELNSRLPNIELQLVTPPPGSVPGFPIEGTQRR